MNSGKHLLALSFSGFDPKRTLPARKTALATPCNLGENYKLVSKRDW